VICNKVRDVLDSYSYNRIDMVKLLYLIDLVLFTFLHNTLTFQNGGRK
jgi:hypothetical protein